MKGQRIIAFIIVLPAFICCFSEKKAAIRAGETPAGETGQVLFGFFPTPAEVTHEGVFRAYKAISEHGNAVLLQYNVPWADFADQARVESRAWQDIRNQFLLAGRFGLETIFVVDPLNGLDRSRFLHLPPDWKASFGEPGIRSAFQNFALQVVRELKPRYLGLASEINFYADFHPADFPNFISLYAEVYDRVKEIAPETLVFVTFQWEGLNNLMPGGSAGEPYCIDWHKVEIFEPRLDVWAISSYPFIVFKAGSDVPKHYYTPLRARTQKPLAVAEGGYTSRPVGPFTGTPEDQVAYLDAINAQIGERLAFWIYLLINDLDIGSRASVMEERGLNGDIQALGFFRFIGLTTSGGRPKPALGVWDSFR